MAQLAEAAEREEDLGRELGQARVAEEEAWTQFWVSLAFSLTLWGFRWVWAILAHHFTRVPQRDPIER